MDEEGLNTEGAGEQATPETDPSDVMAATESAAARQQEGQQAAETPKQEAPKEGAKEGEQQGQQPAKPEDKADQPIKDWSKVKLDIPDGAPLDKPTLDAFGKAAVDLGLTANQANKLLNFQLDQLAEVKQRAYDAGMAVLNKEWGSKFGENSQAVLTLIANVDRELGGSGTEFSQALEQCGATLFPSVCKGLLHLARATSEDSFGKGGAAAQAEHVETALEGLQNALEESKRR